MREVGRKTYKQQGWEVVLEALKGTRRGQGIGVAYQGCQVRNAWRGKGDGRVVGACKQWGWELVLEALKVTREGRG